ncbi:MAG: hypothetical protein JWN03_3760 [Nocardia sp.]|uniref:hypothetical protein n=1 Tax=Nocardia sp. TaxID=1821 RepID=UPI0026167877|nr:hypothetical protein [Nocardia sp.]MCU1643485.1 hypothetical protein [Nocardia sp.]
MSHLMNKAACSLCASALDHCHGTLIAHADGSAECTDWACADTDRLRHPFSADCSDVAGGCECAEAMVSPRIALHPLAG